MPCRFWATNQSSNYRAFQTYHSLTSPLIIFLLIILITISSALGFSLQWEVIVPAPLYVGLELIILGITGILFSLFTFAVTYFPYIKRTDTATSLLQKSAQTEVNVVDVSSYLLLGAIGDYARTEEANTIREALQSLLKTEDSQAMLNRLELDSTQLANTLEQVVVPTLTWPMLATNLLTVASELGADEIHIEHVLAAFLLNPMLKSYLREHDLQEQDIGFVVWWLLAQRHAIMRSRCWWKKERLLSFTGMGLSWTAGFTPLVDRFNHIPRGNIWDEIILGREKYVDELITTLAREDQSNVLLVGQPGVGRLGVANELARRIRDNQAHPTLNGLHVTYLHVGELLAQGGTNAGELAIISKVLAEMENAGNVIAIIDGLGSILGEEGEQRLNLTEVLLPFFSSLTVKVVVILSNDEYHLRLRSNAELIHFFEVVEVPSSSEEETLQVLAAACPIIERRSGVYLPYKSLRALVEGTSGILQQIALPERAFDILDEVIVSAQTDRQPIITKEMVNKLITNKVGVPVGQLEDKEREYLLNLEVIMHERLINQTHAVSAVARAMIRARAGVRNRHRPIGTFLFLGPTGVGKTETAKTLAQVYFGSEDNMIRLDMSEFQSESGVAALMGDANHPIGRLASMISDKPFTVLLLDEFEKAHTTVQQLFLPILDEGQVTDARGQIISFQHAIIIATSNAGAEYIRESYVNGKLPTGFDMQLRDYILRQNIFRPELVNRFDGVVTYTPLLPEHIREIAHLMLKSLNKRLDAQHGITVDISDELVDFLVQNGYDPQFGARPMTRLIQDTIEYQVAQKILQGTTQPGQPVYLQTEGLKNLIAQQR